MAGEHPALTVAAARGLPSSSVAEVAGRTPVVMAPEELDEVLRVARMDRLGGFLARAVEDGVVECDGVAAEAITALWHDDLVASVTVESLAVRTAAVLDGAAIDWRVTKGPAVAHLDYPDPSLRCFGDLDLLIHPDCWTAALHTLADVGFVRTAAELRAGFDLRFGKGATLEGLDGAEIDLHLRLSIGRFGATSLPTDLFGPPAPLALGGRALPALRAEHRLLHACYHASLGGFRHRRALRDVAQITLVTGADWRATVGQAEAWKGSVVVAAAVCEAWECFGLDPAHEFHEWAQRCGSNRRERAALAVFRDERPFRAQALTALGVLAWRDRPRYLFHLAGARHRG